MVASRVASAPVAKLFWSDVRAVSNLVERRNRAAWRMPDALEALGTAIVEIVETL